MHILHSKAVLYQLQAGAWYNLCSYSTDSNLALSPTTTYCIVEDLSTQHAFRTYTPIGIFRGDGIDHVPVLMVFHLHLKSSGHLGGAAAQHVVYILDCALWETPAQALFWLVSKLRSWLCSQTKSREKQAHKGEAVRLVDTPGKLQQLEILASAHTWSVSEVLYYPLMSF